MIAKKIHFLLLTMVISISIGSPAFADGDSNRITSNVKGAKELVRPNNCIDPDPNMEPNEGPDAGLVPEYRISPDIDSDAALKYIPECGPCSENYGYRYRGEESNCGFSCGDVSSVGGEWGGRCDL